VQSFKQKATTFAFSRKKILLCIFLLISCVKSNNYSVKYAGALRDIMHKGDLSGKIWLDSLQNKSHLYGLGALENLKGEILIFDGDPIISTVKEISLNIEKSFDHTAALLVYTQVRKWKEWKLPENILNSQELESFILETAKNHNLEREEPFPFIITGTIKEGKWHVIDWKEGDMEHTPEKHKASGLKGTVQNQGVRIVGFYSNKHQGIFTHRSLNIHMHVVTDDGSTAAHLDNFISGVNTLWLPAIE
jgi:acetolactate decarboxylase